MNENVNYVSQDQLDRVRENLEKKVSELFNTVHGIYPSEVDTIKEQISKIEKRIVDKDWLQSHHEQEGVYRDNMFQCVKEIKKIKEEHFEGSCHPTKVEYIDTLKRSNINKEVLQEFIQAEIYTLKVQKDTQNFSDQTLSIINNTLYRLDLLVKKLESEKTDLETSFEDVNPMESNSLRDSDSKLSELKGDPDCHCEFCDFKNDREGCLEWLKRYIPSNVYTMDLCKTCKVINCEYNYCENYESRVEKNGSS